MSDALIPGDTFAGFILKRREKMSDSLNVFFQMWRSRYVVISGRQLRYYESDTDAALKPRDIIYLAAGSQIDVTWPAGATAVSGGGVGGGSGVSVGGGGAAAREPRHTTITASAPKEPSRSSALIIVRISHPDHPRNCYQFAWEWSPSSPSACAIAERWIAAMRASAAGLLDSAAASAREGRTPEGVSLRNGLKVVNAANALSLEAPTGSGAKPARSDDVFLRTPTSRSFSTEQLTPIPRRSPEPSPSAATPPSQLFPLSLPRTLSATKTPEPSPTSAARSASHSQTKAVFVDAPWPAEPYGEQARDLIAQLRQLSEGDGGGAWVRNGEKNGVDFWKPTDGAPGARGDGVTPYSRAVCLALLLDTPARTRYDSQCIVAQRVRSLDAHSNFIYLSFRGFPFVAGRDVSLFSHWRVDADGTVWIVTQSTEIPDLPVKDGIVRAHIHVGGWVLRALADGGGDDARGCRVTYLFKSDLKGSLPTSITKSVTAQQAALVSTFCDGLRAEHGATPPVLPPPRNLPNSDSGGGGSAERTPRATTPPSRVKLGADSPAAVASNPTPSATLDSTVQAVKVALVAVVLLACIRRFGWVSGAVVAAALLAAAHEVFVRAKAATRSPVHGTPGPAAAALAAAVHAAARGDMARSNGQR